MKKIDNEILEVVSTRTITITELAKELDVSKQTIRNRVKVINKKNENIIIDAGVLIYSGTASFISKISDDEIILFAVLTDNADIATLAEKLFISEKTLYKKVKKYKEEFVKKLIFKNYFQLHEYIDLNYEECIEYLNYKSCEECHKAASELSGFDYTLCSVSVNEISKSIDKPNLFGVAAESINFTNKFIKYIEFVYDSISFSSKTYEDLRNHIRSAYIKLKYQTQIDLNISPDVVIKYGDMYRLFKNNIIHFLEIENMKYIESEYIYIFVILLRDISSEIKKVKNVVILCENGVATSYLIEQQLRDNFKNFKCLYCGSEDEYTNLQFNEECIVINSSNSKKNDCDLQVQGILTRTDIEYLEQYLQRKDMIMLTDYQIYCRIKNNLKPNVDYATFKKSLQVSSKKGTSMLVDLIQPHMIERRKESLEWEDAIRLCATPLLENDYISDGYIDAMIKNVHELGTYIILVDGFALPHSKPEDGSHKAGISVLVIEDGVEFPGERNVNVIMTLSTSKANDHLQALVDLSNLLKIDSAIEDLKSCKDSTSIYEYIKNF